MSEQEFTPGFFQPAINVKITVRASRSQAIIVFGVCLGTTIIVPENKQDFSTTLAGFFSRGR